MTCHIGAKLTHFGWCFKATRSVGKLAFCLRYLGKTVIPSTASGFMVLSSDIFQERNDRRGAQRYLGSWNPRGKQGQGNNDRPGVVVNATTLRISYGRLSVVAHGGVDGPWQLVSAALPAGSVNRLDQWNCYPRSNVENVWVKQIKGKTIN